jgi:hypothetical protein
LSIVWSTGVPRLSITGDIGRRYAVEYIMSLAVNNTWQSLVTNTLTSNPLIIADTIAPMNTNRFYRARWVP